MPGAGADPALWRKTRKPGHSCRDGPAPGSVGCRWIVRDPEYQSDRPRLRKCRKKTSRPGCKNPADPKLDLQNQRGRARQGEPALFDEVPKFLLGAGDHYGAVPNIEGSLIISGDAGICRSM